MHPGTRRAPLDEAPELSARRQKLAAGTTYYAAIVFSGIVIDDRWRTAARAREFFSHPTFPLFQCRATAVFSSNVARG
jgi:hypothetical protein